MPTEEREMSSFMKGLRNRKALMIRAGALLTLLCVVFLTALPTEPQRRPNQP